MFTNSIVVVKSCRSYDKICRKKVKLTQIFNKIIKLKNSLCKYNMYNRITTMVINIIL